MVDRRHFAGVVRTSGWRGPSGAPPGVEKYSPECVEEAFSKVRNQYPG
jgi:hypothetical protein